MELEQLRNPQCKLCDLSKDAKTICIMGSGNIKAKLMLIGEAPGFDEDREGKVFIGQAGKMLTSILDNLEHPIDRKDIYITNVLKCHPPFNSKPNSETRGICSNAYLRREIKAIQPKLIVCLGQMSAALLGQDLNCRINSMRNTVYYTQQPMPANIPFIVTYHPAAVIRNPQDNLLQFMVDDLEWAQKLLDNIDDSFKMKSRYKQLNSILDIPGIGEAEWLDLDLETDGLDPFLPGKEILSLQISTSAGNGYYFDWNKKIAQEVKELFDSIANIKINGHNIKFDLLWLMTKLNIKLDLVKLNDTYQNIHLLNENFPDKSLDCVATSFTELKGHKHEFQRLINSYVKMHKEKKEPITFARTRLWGKAFKSIPLETRIKYGCGDSDSTGRLRRTFRPRLKAEGLLPLHNLMMNVTKTYIDMEYNGVKVNEKAVSKIGKKQVKRINSLEIMLSDIFNINHSSPLQVIDLLYNKWKCFPHEIKQGKKKKKYSSGEDALKLILQDDMPNKVHEYINLLLEYRKLTKLYGTYIQGLPRFLRNGFIHASWNLCGADTGRTSCKNPNLQQIPREGDIKEIFTSRFEDGYLVAFDISQGELRIAAHESQEKELCRLFRAGSNDIHRSVAAIVYKKKESEVTEQERYNAKQVNFAVLYGAGAKTVVQEMKQGGTTEKEAWNFIQDWNNTFSGWKEHVERMELSVIDNHYVRNLFGRKRRLFILNPSSNEGRTALRQAVNAPIQGGLSDLNKLCGYRIWKRTRDKGLFVLEVHDQWVIDIREKNIDYICQVIKEEYENADTSKFGFKLTVPMKVDIKIGKNWKDMEDWKNG